jgi:signal transduction histidine kinase
MVVVPFFRSSRRHRGYAENTRMRLKSLWCYISSGRHSEILWTPSLVKQGLWNLRANAIKFTRRERLVESALLDTGCGREIPMY